jgi:hypothetical protein
MVTPTTFVRTWSPRLWHTGRAIGPSHRTPMAVRPNGQGYCFLLTGYPKSSPLFPIELYEQTTPESLSLPIPAVAEDREQSGRRCIPAVNGEALAPVLSRNSVRGQTSVGVRHRPPEIHRVP